jgi:hypothetical protein
MPNNIINSFSNKTGKTVKEVEKLWDKAKKIASDNNEQDNYQYITGILKNMLSLEDTSSSDVATFGSRVDLVKRQTFKDYYEKIKKPVLVESKVKTDKDPTEILRQNNIKIKSVKPAKDDEIIITLYTEEDANKAELLLGSYIFTIKYKINK